MKLVRYAAYGSNLHPLRLGARAPSARHVGNVFLPDWSLCFHKRSIDASGKCSIRMGSSGVYIAVYEMSVADKQELDRIEGVGAGYVDARIAVPEVGECATYIATASHIDDTLQPYDWYKELVLLGCRELRLPKEYVERIESVAPITDPDPHRRGDNWETVEMLRASLGQRVN